MSVCRLLCATFCPFFKNILLLHYTNIEREIDQLHQYFLGKSYKKDIDLRFCTFGLAMVKNCNISFPDYIAILFLVFVTDHLSHITCIELQSKYTYGQF